MEDETDLYMFFFLELVYCTSISLNVVGTVTDCVVLITFLTPQYSLDHPPTVAQAIQASVPVIQAEILGLKFQYGFQALLYRFCLRNNHLLLTFNMIGISRKITYTSNADVENDEEHLDESIFREMYVLLYNRSLCYFHIVYFDLTLFFLSFHVLFSSEYCVGVGMHYYTSLPVVKKNSQYDNPPYSDTIRLNNLCRNKYIPMGYTKERLKGMPAQMIQADFGVLSEKVKSHFGEVPALIGQMVVDFRMMPGPYGSRLYIKIEEQLEKILFECYGILSPTFVLELPCSQFQWKKIEDIIAVSSGYTATFKKFNLGQLVKSNHEKINGYLRSQEWNTAPENSKWLRIIKNGAEVKKGKINNVSSKSTNNKTKIIRKKTHHTSVVASNTRIMNRECDASDSDRSDVTSLEGKCNLHINVLS